MFTVLKILVKDLLKSARRLRFRATCQKRGLAFAATASFNGRENDFCFGKGCSVGAYSILDATNDPATDNREARIELGDFVYIGESCNLRAAGTPIKIGDHSMVANGVIIVGSNHRMNLGVLMRLQEWDRSLGGIVVEDDCWIGAGAILLPGARVRTGSIVAAGAVVRGEVAPNSIVAGVPARVIKARAT